MRLPYRFGRYTLVEKIAAGGTAEVYRAVQDAGGGLAKTVAVKRLLPSWGDNDELRALLVDEARALLNLQHQSIVQVYELGELEGVPFIAMEFVDGIDCGRMLTDTVRDKTPIPTGHALYIINQVLLALEFAHRSSDDSGQLLGIVHRDISPSNILLSWNGEVKVTDFGIAKGLHRTQPTALGQLRGKYAYMAPEQARGEEIDGRADVFACGVVFCELVTARRLLEAPTDVEVVEKARRAELPAGVLDGLPAELRAVLLLALASDRDRRYQSAVEMLGDVRGVARSLGEMGSSIELAAFLRQRYPTEAAEKKTQPQTVAAVEGETKVLSAVSSSASVQRYLGPRVLRIGRVVVLALIFGAMAVVPSSAQKGRQDGVARQSVDPRGTAPALEMPADVPPPTQRGVIAIDSNPTGAAGTVMIDKKEIGVTTPFTFGDLDVGDGLDVRVRLAMEGYEPLSHEFRLTHESPAFVKNFALIKSRPSRISVNARPWGYVSIRGLISKRETPVDGIAAKAGTYLVEVHHPPSGRRLTKDVTLADGQWVRCLATFDRAQGLVCR